MNINGGAQLSETPGRTGMVEMNVAEEDVANIARFEANSPELVRNVIEG